jgi:hypothetical protein
MNTINVTLICPQSGGVEDIIISFINEVDFKAMIKTNEIHLGRTNGMAWELDGDMDTIYSSYMEYLECMADIADQYANDQDRYPACQWTAEDRGDAPLCWEAAAAHQYAIGNIAGIDDLPF